MLIPAIDLMDGKVVQLVQGKSKALEFDGVDDWVERFGRYPMAHVIDLNAAMGTGENRSLVKHLAGRLTCQVGGGVRRLHVAQELLAAGARKVIIGSGLILDGKPNLKFARELADSVGPERLVFAVDSRGGKVVVDAWRRQTPLSPVNMLKELEPYCDTFLYTHVDTEGLMLGIPVGIVRTLRESTTKRLLVAGGIASLKQVEELDRMDVDAVVGMALYTGLIHA